MTDVPYAWARYGPDVARDLFWQDATALAVALICTQHLYLKRPTSSGARGGKGRA
jgi:hypothetical protein